MAKWAETCNKILKFEILRFKLSVLRKLINNWVWNDWILLELGLYALKRISTLLVKVKVKVTLRLTVSQSVCLGIKPNLGLLTRDDFFFLQNYCLVFFGAHSLTRGRVCHLSLFCQYSLQWSVSQYLHKLFTFCVTHVSHLQFLPLNIHIVWYTRTFHSRLCPTY
jgi:hypothetical protein